MEQEIERIKRRRWTREETEGFLGCYLARKAEFEHPKKKRLAYANVLEDMLSLGVTDSERTPLCLEGRMRTLLQAYKSAKDNNSRTGSSPCFAPYMDLMEEIFGRSPIICNTDTIHLGNGPVEMLDDDSSTSPLPSHSTPSTPAPSPNTSAPTPTTSAPTPTTSGSTAPTSASTASTSDLTTSRLGVARKRSARELYYEKKLELKKKVYEEKKMVREEKFATMKEMIIQKWEKDREIEAKKLLLLENLVNKK